LHFNPDASSMVIVCVLMMKNQLLQLPVVRAELALDLSELLGSNALSDGVDSNERAPGGVCVHSYSFSQVRNSLRRRIQSLFHHTSSSRASSTTLHHHAAHLASLDKECLAPGSMEVLDSLKD
jgi:hypothetical protein